MSHVGVFDLVFSFDTTGSMSRVFDEVKGRVSDMIQRLQSDIPSIRIGVIAHGDYCDRDEFYLEKHVDLSSNIVELTDFVQNVDGTGGGDPEECYEYILHVAKGLDWAPGSNRALVVIGDSVPHEPDYDLNTANLDWRREAQDLAAMGVRIYGVQAFEEAASTAFFQELVTLTSGEHLKLGEFSNICDFILAICYRERGVEYLENYEAEVRAREARMGLHKDLEGMFGVLRRTESNASSKSHPLSRAASSVSCSSVINVTPMPSASNSKPPSFSSVFTTPSTPCSGTGKICLPKKKPCKAGVGRKSPKSPDSAKTVGIKDSNTKNKTTCLVKPEPKYRHLVSDSKFILGQRRFKTRWSRWKQVLFPTKAGHKNDDTIVPRMGRYNMHKVGFRKTRLFPATANVDQALYEVAVQRHASKGLKKYVVFSKLCTIPDSSNWERNLFSNTFVRRQIDAALKVGAHIWVRRLALKGMGRQQKALIDLYRWGGLYKYAWNKRTRLEQPGKLAWAMDTS